jgi:CheY-like chemotaxis protein
MSLSPYHHPTTICLVDDNQSFLDGMILELPSTWACRAFTDPHAALAFLNQPVALPPLAERCLSRESSTDSDAVIHIDLGLIEQEINHPDRFRRISVLVADYAMPSMNGLELCAAARDPHLRKAMLTGVADEKLAVEAFNEGLIHRFIPKHGTSATATAREYIAELQAEYFEQYTALLQSSLAVGKPGFLTDPDVARWVEDLMRTERLVEYYLVDGPPGLILLSSDGRMFRAMILDAADMSSQLDLARRYGAPDHITQGMAEHRHAALLVGDSPADYYGSERYPWEDNVCAVEPVGDDGKWLVGVVRDAPVDIDFDPQTSSYDAYLATLER